MYSVIYSFKIKPDKLEEFKTSWNQLTKLIYKYEGSLGSRLHKKSDSEFIAYAQWPNKATFKNAGGNMPPEADAIRAIMKNACKSIETLHELELIDDLLKQK